MAEDTEGRTLERQPEVTHPHPRPHPPDIARVDQAEQPPGAGGRCPDQRRHIGVAADYPVERDDIGEGHTRGEGHKIAVDVGDTLGIALPLALGAGGGEVGRWCS